MAWNNERKLMWYRRLRMDALYHYGGNPPKCACCGESYLEFLCIDHNGIKKREYKEAGTILFRKLKKENYPKGYRVLCFNCNWAHGMYGYCPHQRPDLAKHYERRMLGLPNLLNISAMMG